MINWVACDNSVLRRWMDEHTESRHLKKGVRIAHESSVSLQSFKIDLITHSFTFINTLA